jgi:hypothetical protein
MLSSMRCQGKVDKPVQMKYSAKVVSFCMLTRDSDRADCLRRSLGNQIEITGFVDDYVQGLLLP